MILFSIYEILHKKYLIFPKILMIFNIGYTKNFNLNYISYKK